MKLVIGTLAAFSGVFFALSMASANPALLPKHEGYPMKNSGSPVTGQPTANDPGQSDAHGESTLQKSAGFDDKHVKQIGRASCRERVQTTVDRGAHKNKQ